MLVMGCYGHSRAREWVLGGGRALGASIHDLTSADGALSLVKVQDQTHVYRFGVRAPCPAGVRQMSVCP